MTVRTVEQLECRLDEALAWRKRELTTLRMALKSARKHQRDLFLRAGIALLYAHWEGFVKNAAEIYIELVAAQRHLCGELASHFVVLSISRLLSDCEQSQKTRMRIAVVDFLRKEAEEPLKIQNKSVNTKSNLNSSVLKDIIELLGLNYAPYETKANLVDKSLLAARNKIAHGEYTDVDEKQYLVLSDEILGLMQMLRDQIGNAAESRAYLRQAPGPSKSNSYGSALL
jgi:hypothetical protein